MLLPPPHAACHHCTPLATICSLLPRVASCRSTLLAAAAAACSLTLLAQVPCHGLHFHHGLTACRRVPSSVGYLFLASCAAHQKDGGSWPLQWVSGPEVKPRPSDPPTLGSPGSPATLGWQLHLGRHGSDQMILRALYGLRAGRSPPLIYSVRQA